MRHLPLASEQDVLGLLRKQVERVGSQKEWARAAGVSTALVNDTLLGRRAVAGAIAQALGFEPVRMYRPQTLARQTLSGDAR